MNKKHFRISSVEVLPEYRLRLTFVDGETFEVNLSGWIENSRSLFLLKEPDLFAEARIGCDETVVEWIEGELDLAGDNLRNLAVEQAGGIGHERIWNWLHETGLNLTEAANALGISRRMLTYYRDGEKPIPRHIWLACLGWEATRPQDVNQLPVRIPSAQEYAALHS